MNLKGAKMSYDDYLCIKEITKSVPITLSTAYQGNEITGISNILDSWKCQYIQQLQGIVVSYRNVTLMSKNAYIKSDYPSILCNVKATFELFIPTVGSIVKGKINRISHDYIGCLVHNTINVAIHCSRNEYDSISHFISLDKPILFEITNIGFKRKIIRVKGKITQECINLMKNIYSTVEKTGAVHHIFTDPQESSSYTDSEEQESTDDRNSRNEMSESIFYNTNLLNESLNDVNPVSSTKKKKSNKFKTGQIHNSHFETVCTENGELSPSLLCNSSKLFVNDLSNKSHDSSKKKKEKSNKEIRQNSFKSCESTHENSKITSPNLLLSESDGITRENSPDKNSHLSKKKKKRKGTFETDEVLDNASFDTPPLSNSYSPKKKKSKKDNSNSLDIKTENIDELIEALLPYDPSLESEIGSEVLLKDKCLDSSKKAKKRKLESPDRDGLPQKKKKTEQSEVSLTKSSDKHKTKKKSKEKPGKDSKKDKKKSKKRVISSKKKLPKLKKKKKGEKLKKKLKKSKHKVKNVP